MTAHTHTHGHTRVLSPGYIHDCTHTHTCAYRGPLTRPAPPVGCGAGGGPAWPVDGGVDAGGSSPSRSRMSAAPPPAHIKQGKGRGTHVLPNMSCIIIVICVLHAYACVCTSAHVVSYLCTKVCVCTQGQLRVATHAPAAVLGACG